MGNLLVGGEKTPRTGLDAEIRDILKYEEFLVGEMWLVDKWDEAGHKAKVECFHNGEAIIRQYLDNGDFTASMRTSKWFGIVNHPAGSRRERRCAAIVEAVQAYERWLQVPNDSIMGLTQTIGMEGLRLDYPKLFENPGIRYTLMVEIIANEAKST